jgi:hypothetical protein
MAGSDAKLVVMSALFVTGGVIFSAAVKLHSEERDRAFKFLSENQNNPELLKALLAVSQFRTANEGIKPNKLRELYLDKSKEARKFMGKVSFICNFFEEMAIGVKYRQIHEGIVRDYYIGMLCRIGVFMEPFLPLMRNIPQIDDHPFGSSQRPEIFENMEWLYRRWTVDYERDCLPPTKESSFSSSRKWTGRVL